MKSAIISANEIAIELFNTSAATDASNIRSLLSSYKKIKFESKKYSVNDLLECNSAQNSMESLVM